MSRNKSRLFWLTLSNFNNVYVYSKQIKTIPWYKKVIPRFIYYQFSNLRNTNTNIKVIQNIIRRIRKTGINLKSSQGFCKEADTLGKNL